MTALPAVIEAFDVDELERFHVASALDFAASESLVNPDFDACEEQTKRKKEPRNAEHNRL